MPRIPKLPRPEWKGRKPLCRRLSESGNKSQQDQAEHLVGMIDAIDVVKGGDQTAKALQQLWQDTKKLDTNEPVLKKK